MLNFKPIDLCLTGDNPPHAIWEQTLDGQLSVGRWVTETMRRLLPSNVLAFPSLGNHGYNSR